MARGRDGRDGRRSEALRHPTPRLIRACQRTLRRSTTACSPAPSAVESPGVVCELQKTPLFPHRQLGAEPRSRHRRALTGLALDPVIRHETIAQLRAFQVQWRDAAAAAFALLAGGEVTPRLVDVDHDRAARPSIPGDLIPVAVRILLRPCPAATKRAATTAALPPRRGRVHSTRHPALQPRVAIAALRLGDWRNPASRITVAAKSPARSRAARPSTAARRSDCSWKSRIRALGPTSP